jgi:hypothetical protein
LYYIIKLIERQSKKKRFALLPFVNFVGTQFVDEIQVKREIHVPMFSTQVTLKDKTRLSGVNYFPIVAVSV